MTRLGTVWLLGMLAAGAAGAQPCPAPLPPGEVHRLARAAVVLIKTTGTTASGAVVKDRLGSGVVVHPEGWVLTALHNVDADEDWATEGNLLRRTVTVSMLGGANGKRRFRGGQLAKDMSPVEAGVPAEAVRIVDFDRLADQAVLKIEAGKLPFFWLRDSPGVEPGDRAYAIPWGPRAGPELVSADVVNPTDPANLGRLKLDDAPIGRGDSGGLVADRCGMFLGLVSQGREGEQEAAFISRADASSLVRSRIPPAVPEVGFETPHDVLRDKDIRIKVRSGDGYFVSHANFDEPEPLRPDTYHAEPSLGALLQLHGKPFVVKSDQHKQKVDLRYTVSISGKVVAVESEHGLAGYRVSIDGAISNVTRDDGVFRVRGLPLRDEYGYKAYSANSSLGWTKSDPYTGTIVNAGPTREFIHKWNISLHRRAK